MASPWLVHEEEVINEGMGPLYIYIYINTYIVPVGPISNALREDLRWVVCAGWLGEGHCAVVASVRNGELAKDSVVRALAVDRCCRLCVIEGIRCNLQAGGRG